MNKQIAYYEGFSKVLKKLSREIYVGCGVIDKMLEYFPVERRDVSRSITSIKAAVSELKRYAAAADGLSIICASRPAEFDFISWLNDAISTMQAAVERLAEQLRENHASFFALDLVSLSLGELEYHVCTLDEMANGLKVGTVQKASGEHKPDKVKDAQARLNF